MSDEETMLERVMWAIHKGITEACARTELGDDFDLETVAKGAIAAMREPTMRQYEALSATGKMWRDLNSETVWKTYIDAALSE